MFAIYLIFKVNLIFDIK